MEPLVCKQCGGAINPVKMRCEYCGTYYKRSDDLTKPLQIIYHQGPRADVLQAGAYIDSCLVSHINQEDIGRILHSEITRKMAEALEPYMEYTVQEDPVHLKYVVRGRVRVLPPGYSFD